MSNLWRSYKLVVIGFMLVLIGWLIPMLTVLRIIPSYLALLFFSFACSVGGLFVGLMGVASKVIERRRRDQ